MRKYAPNVTQYSEIYAFLINIVPPSISRRYKITGKAATTAFPWPAPPTPKLRILAQPLKPSKFFQKGKVSVMSGDTKMKNDWDFLLKGTFPKSDF